MRFSFIIKESRAKTPLASSTTPIPRVWYLNVRSGVHLIAVDTRDGRGSGLNSGDLSAPVCSPSDNQAVYHGTPSCDIRRVAQCVINLPKSRIFTDRRRQHQPNMVERPRSAPNGNAHRGAVPLCFYVRGASKGQDSVSHARADLSQSTMAHCSTVCKPSRDGSGTLIDHSGIPSA